TTSGELRLRGPAAPITIRRDKWGVPHIDAANEADAYFAIGFCQGQDRAGEAQVAALAPEVRVAFESFAAGLTAGMTAGLPRKPHEFAIVGGVPSAWDAADVLGVIKLQSFLLPSNWDTELARLRILLADGPAAVEALEPPQGRPTP